MGLPACASERKGLFVDVMIVIALPLASSMTEQYIAPNSLHYFGVTLALLPASGMTK
jgi:hypothetical protein